ncbi:hypothetical protein O0L34_g18346 [Tuta absoluta]|nr:hypothetical protein O0L34_g18346 [Tuta absoluta]
MVTRIGPLSFHEEVKIKHLITSVYNYNNNKYPRHVLKSKHKHKPKCKRLYKYRLRPNGEEDPEVIDVSHSLLTTLLIRSPTKLLKSPLKHSDLEELRPKNYLFKMAWRKQKVKSEATEAVVKNGPVEAKALASPRTETQSKKQTNAFQLLMDSRNKSIGTNSPGKEKCYDNDPSEIQEKIEKKNLKVKRNLVLQKMAEAKGSLKRKEKEEYEDKFIEKQMEKRAERLKSMIKIQKAKASKVKKKEEKASKNDENIVNIEEDSNSNDVAQKSSTKTKSLQLVDMFLKPKSKSPEKKDIPKEDKVFLSKLSPSIKKKENMLCYFKKVDKLKLSDEDEDVPNDSPVIKVKLSQKNKKKLKKKRLSLNKISSEVLKDHNENSDNNDAEIQAKTNRIPENLEIQQQSHERKKRKRKENLTEVADKGEAIDILDTDTDIRGRPRRNVKRPVKYSEDVELSSSDEELQIFTPRKKKRNDDIATPHLKDKIKEIVVSDDECIKKANKSKKNPVKEEKVQKKPTKIAPIFAPKPQLNPEQLEAKQKFLYSGVPEQLKKIIAQQKILHTEITNDFPVVVHIQQNETKSDKTIKLSSLPDSSSDDDVDVNDNKEHLFSKLISTIVTSNPNNLLPSPKSNVTAILQNIKEHYPKFPVHRTYRLLKSKSHGEFKGNFVADLDNSSEIIESIVDNVNENPEYLNWTDKYKATSTKHLIGNFESLKELKKWLLSWTEIDQKIKKTKAKESDCSDFYDSDSNSKDSFKNNLLVVTGPVGSGKTSSVYAVAAELAIKVIEVNASSKRTGKVMLQELQEATQSHKVNRGGLENSQKSQEIVETVTTIVGKKRGRPKKLESTLKKTNSKDEGFSQSQPNGSQDQVRTGMSLILVDDADIVFEQDDGFSSAIAQLTQCSKRPVILVTGSDTCPHLQRFLQYGKVIYMYPLLPRMLGTWLDIMCLAEGSCWLGLGPKVLNYFKGDIRKSINCLQFYMTAQDCLKRDKASSLSSDVKQIFDDENSNMSWPDSEGTEEKTLVESSTEPNDIVWKQIMHKEMHFLHSKYPKDLFNVWWNVPSLFQYHADTHVPKEVPKDIMVQDLEAIANVMDSLSIADYYSYSKPDTSCNLTSKPWFTSESNSVSEQECMDNYNKCHEVTSDILQEMVASSIVDAQKTLQCERNTYIQCPSVAEQREKDRVTSVHDSLTSILNPSAALDRKSLALDYWSACRTICRVEKYKTDTVSKRNNRFCHYLKSLNVTCRNEAYDILGDSLCFKGKVD